MWGLHGGSSLVGDELGQGQVVARVGRDGCVGASSLLVEAMRSELEAERALVQLTLKVAFKLKLVLLETASWIAVLLIDDIGEIVFVRGASVTLFGSLRSDPSVQLSNKWVGYLGLGGHRLVYLCRLLSFDC